jgi:hypothetical protein
MEIDHTFIAYFFVISRILVIVISCFGILGSSVCVWILFLLQREHKEPHNYLLITLGLFDILYLSYSVFWSISHIRGLYLFGWFSFDEVITWISVTVYIWVFIGKVAMKISFMFQFIIIIAGVMKI